MRKSLFFTVFTLGAAGAAVWWARHDGWFAGLAKPDATHSDSDSKSASDDHGHDHKHDHDHEHDAAQIPNSITLSDEARQNLGLVSTPAALETYWKKLQIPGAVVDRPGRSDRGVTAPAVGAVVKVHAFPGDTIKPGDRLFTIRVFSEYLQNTQSELFKASREVQLVQEQKARLSEAVKSGAVAESKLIELDNQLRRFAAASQAYRQDLLTRGFSPAQVDGVVEGQFVSTIEIVAPPVDPAPNDGQPRTADETPELLEPPRKVSAIINTLATDSAKILLVDHHSNGPSYEMQELKVNLGQQVQAGEVLCLLSNHRSLFVEGHAFKSEASSLERAAQERWPIEVEFAEDDSPQWPALDQTFEIHHLANSIDPQSRTFDFFIPLTNQSRSYERDGKTFVVWRFRPGQRVRLHVPIEKLESVIVLPAGAVVKEGPEAYVFAQVKNRYDRRPVNVVHEDRLHVVINKNVGIKPGVAIAQGSAATLNRVLKAQATVGEPSGVHVHADGTVHGAH